MDNDPTRWQQQLGLDRSEYDPNARRKSNPILDRKDTDEKPSVAPVPPAQEDVPDSDLQDKGRAHKLDFLVAPLRKKGARRWIATLLWGLVGAMVLGTFGVLPGYGFLIVAGFMFFRFTKPVRTSKPLRITITILAVILLVLAYIYSRNALYL